MQTKRRLSMVLCCMLLLAISKERLNKQIAKY